MEEPATVSVAEAALATGFTRQSIYRAIRDGRLNRHLIRDSKGRARLMPEALTAIRSGLLRLRADSGAGQAPAVDAEPSADVWAADASAVGERWEATAAPPADLWAPWANALLDCSLWTPPPWNPTRWRTLAIVAAEAEALALQWGEFDAEILQGLMEAGEV